MNVARNFGIKKDIRIIIFSI